MTRKTSYNIPWRNVNTVVGIAMFEHRHQALLPRAAFVRRFLIHISAASSIIIGSLTFGILGYHYLEHLSWIDSLLNASMILGGMGPVNALQTSAGKIFASFYALYSGIVFLVAAGLIIAPLLHRFMHKFHLELSDDSTS